MSALFIGFLLVVLSAVGFGFALFGRRPIPQPATEGSKRSITAGQSDHDAESVHSVPMAGETIAARMEGVSSPVLIERPDDATVIPANQVRVPLGVRARSSFMLSMGAVGAAVLVGAILSIVLVGLVLFIV